MDQFRRFIADQRRTGDAVRLLVDDER